MVMARSHSSGDLTDFFKEFEDIESNKETDGEEEEISKTPDEGEQEAAWLKEVGLDFLVHKHQAGKELTEDDVQALTECFPSKNVAVVQKRVETLNATLRKTQKYITKVDVRNIFPQQPSSTNDNKVHNSEMAPHNTISTKQPIARPTTLPRSFKLSINGDNNDSLKRQNKKHIPHIFGYNGQSCGPSFGPSYCPLCYAQMFHISSQLESLFVTNNDCFYCQLKTNKKSLSPVQIFSYEDSLFYNVSEMNILSSSVTNEVFFTSDILESENMSGSFSRSNSSSCDILNSLDSGLESSESILNMEISSSGDPLEFLDTTAYFSKPSNPVQKPCHISHDESSAICVPPPLHKLNSAVRNIFRGQQGTVTKLTKHSTSPTLETEQPNFIVNKGKVPAKGHTTFMKNKGGYSMSGISEEVQDNTQYGVEMLSLHHRDSQKQCRSTLTPISDSDITFEIKIEESGHNEKTVFKKSDSNEGLPNFTLVPDKLGLTTIDDVSSVDLVLLKNQALLELTSMFDTHNITYYRRRTKKKFKEHGVFGVPLQMMLEYDRRIEPTTRIPLVFKQMLSYLVKHGLGTEGILRVPGSTSRVKQLRQELEDKFYYEPFSWDDDLTPNDVAALMKQFLRDLPKPLLTDEYIEAFAQVENLPDKIQQLHALNLLVILLPDEHRDTLQALLEFLEMIIQQKNTNKMTLNNVAMIMAPNLFLPPKVRSSDPSKNKTGWELEMKMALDTSDIMRLLIRYRDILWTKMKFLAKKDKTDVYKKPALKHEADFQDQVIRIQVPNLIKGSTAIKLNSSITAGDIVSRFRVNQRSNEKRLCYTTVGGHFGYDYYTLTEAQAQCLEILQGSCITPSQVPTNIIGEEFAILILLVKSTPFKMMLHCFVKF